MLPGDNENFHGEEVVLFLRQFKSEVGGPWTIVWDRKQIHSKAQVVKAWLAGHPEVVVEDCPAPTPRTPIRTRTSGLGPSMASCATWLPVMSPNCGSTFGRPW